MNLLAGVYRLTGKQDQALTLFEGLVAARRANLGPHHPETLGTQVSLALTYADTGKRARALELMEQTLSSCRAKLGEEHPETVRARYFVADLYVNAGRPDQAVPLFEQVLAYRQGRLPADHPDTLRAMTSLARAHGGAGQLDRVPPLLDDALRRLTARFGPDDPNTRRTAEVLKAVQNALDAQKRYEELRKANAPAAPNALGALREVAESRLGLGNLDGAESALAEVLVGMTSLAGDDATWETTVGIAHQCVAARQEQQPEGWRTFSSKSLLGAALLGQKNYAEAEPLLLAGYEGLRSHADALPEGVRAGRLTEALQRLVTLYEATDRKDEAARWQKELDVARARHGGTKN
jgi:tetratricopeptide (TPR) repeat protein